MEVALDNIATMEAEHKVLILGDMLELGEWSEEAHINILRKADTIAERIILVGNEFAKAYDKICNGERVTYTTPVFVHCSGEHITDPMVKSFWETVKEELLTDPQYAPLREREDFQALLDT
jgi:UDP-N-acetylmuramoyl-tripeptide--D-alanyl-D-alanine ligase